MLRTVSILLAFAVVVGAAGLVHRTDPLPGVPIVGPVSVGRPDAKPGHEPAVQVLDRATGVRPADDVDRGEVEPGTDAWVTIKSETFEGSFPNEWDLYGDPTWDDESYRHHGGSWSGYCVGSSVSPPGPYPDDARSWMIYGPFSLSDANDAMVEFHHWLDTEQDYDYFFWGASVDDSVFHGYQTTGRNQSWECDTFDLTDVPQLGNLCGEPQVWIGFLFDSDINTHYEGVYLDDIVVRKNSGGGGGVDLVAYQPSGWDFPIVPSNVTGTHTVPSELQPGTNYVDWAGRNAGDAATADTFFVYLYLDNTAVAGWYAAPPVAAGGSYYAEDYEMTIQQGNHTLATFQDSTNRIAESNENNNRWSRAWTWGGGGGGGDYEHVTITSSSFSNSFAPLGSFIEANLGLNDTVVTTQAIYSSFPGRDNQEKIRNFIKDAYQDWGTTHILLAGDDEIIPGRDAYGRVNNQTEYLPCDLYYSDLDGTWDGDNDGVFGEPTDGVDMYPDVYVGRASVSNSTAAARFVNKFTQYSGNPTAAYLENVLLNGFDLDGSTYGQTTMDFYETNFLPQVMKPANKVYDSHSGNHKTNTISQLNSGQNVWVHSDHGQWNALGTGSRNHNWHLGSGDMGSLSNSNKYTVLISMACLVGAFDQSDCVVEDFMNATNGGVAAMTNSRYGWYNPGYNPQRTLSALFSERAVQELFSLPGHGSLQDFATAKSTLVPSAQQDMAYRWCMYCLNLFGEPRMFVWIPGQSGTSEPDVPARPGAGLRLTADPVFRSQARIRFVLPVAGQASAAVYDGTGRKVRTFETGPLPAGSHEFAWDGTSDGGRTVPNGIYYLRLQAGDERACGKLVKIGEE